MKKILKYSFILALIFLLSTCKKRPDEITISVYDPLLDQVASNAEISLVESSYSGGIFNSSTNCNVLKIATTDGNGTAIFKNIKLKNNSKYNYFASVSHYYDHQVYYSCANQSKSNYLKKTNNSINKKIYYFSEKASYKVLVTNLGLGFSSDPSDSICISINRNFGYFSDFDSPLNGDKSGGYIYYNKKIYDNYPSPPESFDMNFLPILPGKYKITVYKRRSGIVTTSVYDDKILPFEEHVFTITW